MKHRVNLDKGSKSLLDSLLTLFTLVCLVSLPVLAQKSIELTPLGSYRTGIFADGAAEIVAHDPGTQRLFVVNGAQSAIDVLDMSDPNNLSLAFSIDLTPYGKQANSVAVHGGIVAAAVEANVTQDPGSVVFFDTDGNFLNQVPAGALPDMITFTPNGKYVLVANEGEPSDDYTVDPEGSVTVVDLRKGVNKASASTADFSAFNGAALDPSIRIFGPGATVAQDLEPEYIAVSNNSKTAWVTLQENNGLAVVDIKSATVTELIGLGFKDHSDPGNKLDASNEDDAINIANWPVNGMYQPDAITAYKTHGGTYLITANEGDSRDYDGFSEEERVGDVTLDPTAFPTAATLQLEENLGRLKITTTLGDTDNDGDFDQLFSYGARSFSIYDASGNRVFDSGDELEQITAALLPADFNSDDEENGSFDDRSDDKGPEPEGVVVGKVRGRHYAFVGLERVGGIMVYDVTDPAAPEFVQYINTRDFSGDPQADTAGDMSPEGLIFIRKSDSPIGKDLLVVAYEISGSTTVYAIDRLNKKDLSKGELADAETSSQIEKFSLEQNYPNPFNPETEIRFQLPQASEVELTIYNTLGQVVRTLASGEFQSGQHSLRWDGRNNAGQQVTSGVYLYKLVTNQNVALRKMTLMR